jgi:hypothetical protein
MSRRAEPEAALVREWQERRRELLRESRTCKTDDSIVTSMGLNKERLLLQQQCEDLAVVTSKRVSRVGDGLKALHECVKTKQSTEAIRTAIDQFESRLNSAKASLQAAYEKLVDEEKALDSELSQVILHEYEDVVGVTSKERETEKQAAAQKISDKFQKTLAIQAQIGSIDRRIAQLGGRCGNWDSRDHDAFLAGVVKTVGGDILKLQSTRGVVPRLLMLLPNKSDTEVEEHISWY